jgi:hypothetical protein
MLRGEARAQALAEGHRLMDPTLKLIVIGVLGGLLGACLRQLVWHWMGWNKDK